MNSTADSRLPDSCFVVVPAYNEAPRIGHTLEGLLEVARSVVVVDDGSADNTSQVVQRYPVWLVRHPVNLGQGAAIQTGITFALRQGAEYVATFDADGQHEPADLVCMLEELRQTGVDYVLGSRFLGRAEGIPFTRKLMLKAAVWYTRLMSGIRVTDTHNGIRMMTRRGAQRIHITMNRMEHASEIIDQIARSGLRFIEVPVT
ncbi:MAG: glycosyltransferase family 2 protein, partial [Armatimonadota bacterium]